MPWYVRAIVDTALSIGCLLGVFFGGVITIIAWVCIALILVKSALMVFTNESFIVGLIAELIVLAIPCLAGFLLGLLVFHITFLRCVFLSGAFTCTVGWLTTIFDMDA